MASTIFTYEVMVTDVINKGAIQQVTNYCRPIEYDTQSEWIYRNSSFTNIYIKNAWEEANEFVDKEKTKLKDNQNILYLYLYYLCKHIYLCNIIVVLFNI